MGEVMSESGALENFEILRLEWYPEGSLLIFGDCLGNITILDCNILVSKVQETDDLKRNRKNTSMMMTEVDGQAAEPPEITRADVKLMRTWKAHRVKHRDTVTGSITLRGAAICDLQLVTSHTPVLLASSGFDCHVHIWKLYSHEDKLTEIKTSQDNILNEDVEKIEPEPVVEETKFEDNYGEDFK